MLVLVCVCIHLDAMLILGCGHIHIDVVIVLGCGCIHIDVVLVLVVTYIWMSASRWYKLDVHR